MLCHVAVSERRFQFQTARNRLRFEFVSEVGRDSHLMNIFIGRLSGNAMVGIFLAPSLDREHFFYRMMLTIFQCGFCSKHDSWAPLFRYEAGLDMAGCAWTSMSYNAGEIEQFFGTIRGAFAMGILYLKSCKLRHGRVHGRS